MALVHERLYRTEDLAEIDFREYLEDLCGRLMGSYAVDRQRILLTTHVTDISLGIDAAIPSGLIVNELVSNALKYAFPNGRAGTIRVELRPAGEASWCLRIADDGVGPPLDFDYHNPSTLGLKLVHALVRQLHGEMAQEEGAGTSFLITFPIQRLSA